ncbi:hypothetical protein M427DRAFT_62639 [Gonapodya prolifera JEL478]|uniref:Uncharacterized protein n=1 Tax=Gonapodya prolifera (strain JEL478) TaxID=1344416 RepID=A0A139A0E1_GONPJ|nr:hypothetical protein M427DRAFT_62639 [Gonapodya prolifera JEL478]|eukprot:KXS10229.1 hypothetical protein M427DRAFT_62639 [Gonapodya prolifera JEL478]
MQQMHGMHLISSNNSSPQMLCSPFQGPYGPFRAVASIKDQEESNCCAVSPL